MCALPTPGIVKDNLSLWANASMSTFHGKVRILPSFICTKHSGENKPTGWVCIICKERGYDRKYLQEDKSVVTGVRIVRLVKYESPRFNPSMTLEKR